MAQVGVNECQMRRLSLIGSIRAVHASKLADEIVVARTEGNMGYFTSYGEFLMRKEFNEAEKEIGGTFVPLGPTRSAPARQSYKGEISITVDDDGTLLTVDLTERAILRINLESRQVFPIFHWKEKAHPLVLPTTVLRGLSGRLVIVDRGANCLWELDPDGNLELLAGRQGERTNALNAPIGAVARPGVGYAITDSGNHCIKLLSIGNERKVVLYAGTGLPGCQDGPLLDASFHRPSLILSNAFGDMLVCDSPSSRIRLIQGGLVSTLAKCTPSLLTLPTRNIRSARNTPHWINGLDVTREGNLAVSMETGLYLLPTASTFADRWVTRRISYLHLRELDHSTYPTVCDFEWHITGPNGLPTRLPTALLALRCPSALIPNTANSTLHANISNEAVDAFVNYILDDSLTARIQGQNSIRLAIHLLSLSSHYQLPALEDTLDSIVRRVCHNPISASVLTAGLCAAIEVELESLALDFMAAVSQHNRLFSNSSDISNLAASLSPEKRSQLKACLQKGPTLPRAPKPLPPTHPATGLLSTQLRQLLQRSLDNDPIHADFTLVALNRETGDSASIPCHSFVLHSRWLFARPFFRHNSFIETLHARLELKSFDGQWLDLTWATHFLKFLYYGDLSGLQCPQFVDILLENADFLMLRSILPAQGDEPDHNWFLARAAAAQRDQRLELAGSSDEDLLENED